jgi:UDP-N-acetylmuramate--alanine ligase
LINAKKVHFVGIGGSGMFPLACILLERGLTVSGSDMAESSNTKDLRLKGAKIYIGHDAENINDAELVVYSGAVKETNREVKAAIDNGVEIISRSKFLGKITQNYSKLIAISGSHGKSTTTSMIACMLMESGLDPTAIIGARLKKIGGNARVGKSGFAVCEACEYMDSFLDLKPNLGVILNVDDDHLDYFVDLKGVINSFEKFSNNCENLIVNADDENSIAASENSKAHKIFYGLKPGLHWSAENIEINDKGCAKFDVLEKGNKIFDTVLKIPGKHNVYNCLAAIAACRFAGADTALIKASLEEFTGAERRFEKIGKIKNITIIDDFAHHPSEIKATLKTAMSLGFKRVWAVFQPHTFSRTFFLMDDFARALSIADRVILTDILPVREVNTYGVKSEDLSNKIGKSECLGSFENVAHFMAKNAESGDLILTMGGGDIYKCAHMIFENLK